MSISVHLERIEEEMRQNERPAPSKVGFSSKIGLTRVTISVLPCENTENVKRACYRDGNSALIKLH